MVNCISCSDAYKALNALEVSLQVFSVVDMAIVVATKPGLISVDFRNTLVRFGTPPSASGDYSPFSESDLGTLAATAAAATGNRFDCGCVLSLVFALFPFGSVLQWAACLLSPLWCCFCASSTPFVAFFLLEGRIEAVDSDGVMVAGRLKDDVVRVTKRSDRMMISVVIDGEAVNVINAYAPHVALRDVEKKRLWDALDELMRECPADERLIIEGDLNGHIGAASDGYDGVHGGFGFGDKNEEGIQSYSLLPHTIWWKRHRREAIGRPRILWKNLKGEAVETFRAIVFEKLSALVEDMYAHNADQMWNTFAGVIRDVAKDSLGVASESARTHSTHRESWWRPERIKEVGSSRHQMNYDCYYLRINQGDVMVALQRTRRNKVVGPDQIPIEAWRCLEDEGVKWLTCLFNKIFLSAKMPDEWRLSEVIPLYKNKGDAQACSNYRGIKLLSHTMKLWERVIERRLRTKTMVSENQFGFMSGRSTTKEIHLLRSLIEKYRERQRDLHFAFLDLEKACDSVSHDIVLIAESAEELNNIIERYEVVHQEVDIHIRDRILQPKEYFRYLGVAIRPAMLYGSKCWPIIKAQANRVEVAELRMLRWTYGITMVDMIPNGVFRAELDVDYIINKMREGRLRWFRHVKRRT
nr:hypothetical protein [Tanacetum cinerariifolium]